MYLSLLPQISSKMQLLSCPVCLATLPLEGAGPLVSLSPIDCTNLLCASFSYGLHHIQLGRILNQFPGSGTGGADSLEIKLVARF